MNKNNGPESLTEYYSTIYKRYDLVNHLFTLGMDIRWRTITASECLKYKPSNIIDLCCGTGDMVLKIHELVQGRTRIVGYDFNEPMLQIARKKALRRNLNNIEFIRGDVARMPFADGEFDCITIAFGFRNLTYNNPALDAHLSEMARVLKSGGQLLILESAVPTNRIIRVFYKLYLRCFLVLLGGLLSGNRRAYQYLAESSANFYNQTEIKDILGKYGFVVKFVKPFFFGAASLLSAFRR